jgi:diketogulonate reductase-like aldo/keto reductase
MEDYIVLNNGVKMPKIGYGVYQIPASITERCVSDALRVGYRHIDTAQCYGNERAVGKAVEKSRLKREEVFITTKLWGGHGYKDTLRSIDISLRELELDYVDLLLIHEPTGDFNEIYRAMETSYQEGKLRALGVANFLETNFNRLLKTAKVVPAVNQIETHVFRQQEAMRKLMKEYGTQPQSWAPLAEAKNGILTNDILVSIARTHNKTAAQIALRFLYQQDILIIPKSTHMERMKENLDVRDFSLTETEMEQIRKLEKGKSLFSWW